MGNKKKSWILLLVFSFSFFPFYTGQAENPDRTFSEARTMLYLGDAFLEAESELDNAVYFPGLMAPAAVDQGAEGAEEVMDRMIHAAKQERNDLDANCNQLKSRYQIAGNQEAARKISAYCRAEHQKLTNRIEFLRKLRGDRRKLFTRWWHSIKRDSANFWRRIGPLGRNILRKVGDEAFNTVVSGGSLNSEVVRRLAKQAFQNTAREKMKQMVFRGVERLLGDQIRIAREAGVLDEEEQSGSSDEDFLSGDLEGDADHSNADGRSDDQVSESINDSSSSQDTYEMTPEEESNAGKHSYSWDVYLLGEYENSGEQITEHEFSNTGVIYRFYSENNQETYSTELMRVGPNEYARDDGSIKIIYKMTGYESTLSSGHFYTFTLDD